MSDKLNDALKQALHDYNEEHSSKQAQFSVDLGAKLKTAVDKWIEDETRKKKSELNQTVNQNWEALPKHGPRIHYEYTLRAFDINVYDFDILQTGSVKAPYIGMLDIREILYAQRNFPGNISDPRKYYYTVTNPLKIRFDYMNEQFVPGKVEEGKSSIEADWPDEIVQRVKFSFQ
ncbi:MAG: hypothetical protein PHN59_07615 [Candidatus Omnitrophica bacterium]|nr:hypothetical protein [Candidatus Omnitrophota bacterium]